MKSVLNSFGDMTFHFSSATFMIREEFHEHSEDEGLKKKLTETV